MALLRQLKGSPAGCLVRVDCKPSRYSRLRFRLVVFRRQRDLCRYWRRAWPYACSLGRDCRGAVHELVEHRERADGRRRTLRDPRLFCVIGLIQSHLTMRIITHESVHAALAYHRRVGRRSYAREFIAQMEEEAICYPAGDIGRAICIELAKHELI